MDQNKKWHLTQKIKRTAEALEANQYAVHIISDAKALITTIDSLIPSGASVCVGGSMTLFETGVIEHLRSGKYDFWDRYAPGLTPQDVQSIFVKSFTSDVYLTSTNALIEDGSLYNVDGNGNRVAAMLYGPKRVFVIVGANKIVPTLQDAIHRNEQVAAPTNARRLMRETPCAVTGICSNCKSPERICCNYVLMKRQVIKDRIHVFILSEDFGY